jgi:glycosyltransferase involved in cell wall biosynthesis
MAATCANIRRLPIPPGSIIHAQRPDDLLPFLLREADDFTWVCTVHGNPFDGMRWERSGVVFAGYAALENLLLRRVARVIFVDSPTARRYLMRYPWLKDACALVPNPVDTQIFHPTDRASAKSLWGFKGTTFLYAGRLEPEKRVVEIVRAFRELDAADAQLVIAGDGRDRIAVEREAQGASVRFLGTIDKSKMPGLMSAADAVILFSTREGLPSAILEALACGTPSIATPAGALPDVIRDGENGFLVSSRAHLVNAMRSILRGDVVAGASIARTVEPYSWTSLGPKILRSYADALKSN